MNSIVSQQSRASIPPYVGVTGVQEAASVIHLVHAAARHSIGDNCAHRLMLGCLVSKSTVNNAPPANTTKPYRHVGNREVLVEILAAARDHAAIGMLHFELSKAIPSAAGEAQDVVPLLQFLSQRGLQPPIQLNGVLQPDDVKEIHRATGAPIVLQLRRELSDRGEVTILQYIEQIADSIAMILMDPSAGTGEAFSVESVVKLHDAIAARFPKMFSFGFAGGLGGAEPSQIAQTSDVVQQLCKALHSTDFSVDIETRARLAGAEAGTDVLDIPVCDAYFSAVSAGFRSSAV